MWYTVKYSCGHEANVQLYGKTSERERRIAWLEQYGECPECYAKQQAEKREAEKANAANAVDEMLNGAELVELNGSEKQVAWANDIRRKAIAGLREAGMRGALTAQAIELINSKSEARWWIDNRTACEESKYDHRAFVAVLRK